MDEGEYKVFAHNDVYIGDFLVKEDGYFDWWQPTEQRGGFWPAYMLRALADKLDELNAAWDAELKEALGRA